MPPETTPEKIPSAFERLAAVNVGPHTEKKNGLTYLSWAWAWDQLLRQDPEAGYEYLEPRAFGNDTVMVYCAVTAFGVTRTAHLPVMDHRNKAISFPDAFAVNTAMQRCLVKAIALHGLGLYIYAGEDLPLSESEAAEQEKGRKTSRQRENPDTVNPDNGKPITALQQKDLVERAKRMGRNPTEVKMWLKVRYGVDSSAELLRRDFQSACTALEAPGPLVVDREPGSDDA